MTYLLRVSLNNIATSLRRRANEITNISKKELSSVETSEEINNVISHINNDILHLLSAEELLHKDNG